MIFCLSRKWLLRMFPQMSVNGEKELANALVGLLYFARPNDRVSDCRDLITHFESCPKDTTSKFVFSGS